MKPKQFSPNIQAVFDEIAETPGSISQSAILHFDIRPRLIARQIFDILWTGDISFPQFSPLSSPRCLIGEIVRPLIAPPPAEDAKSASTRDSSL
jgi:hypothetical protein